MRDVSARQASSNRSAYGPRQSGSPGVPALGCRRLSGRTAQVPHDAARRDRIPVGPLDLDDDQHLLVAVHLDGQVHAPATAPDEPPLAFGNPIAPASRA
jgi:hypothetical protein